MTNFNFALALAAILALVAVVFHSINQIVEDMFRDTFPVNLPKVKKARVHVRTFRQQARGFRPMPVGDGVARDRLEGGSDTWGFQVEDKEGELVISPVCIFIPNPAMQPFSLEEEVRYWRSTDRKLCKRGREAATGYARAMYKHYKKLLDERNEGGVETP